MAPLATALAPQNALNDCSALRRNGPCSDVDVVVIAQILGTGLSSRCTSVNETRRLAYIDALGGVALTFAGINSYLFAQLRSAAPNSARALMIPTEICDLSAFGCPTATICPTR